MASTPINIAYGSDAQSITITLNSLGQSDAQASTVIENTTNLFLEALVVVIIVAAASGVSANGTADIYAYGSVDDGANYPEGITGTNGSITLNNPTNLRRIGTLFVNVDSTTYVSEPLSVASAFGGVLPSYWGIVVVNNSGAAFASSGCSAEYQGVYAQV